MTDMPRFWRIRCHNGPATTVTVIFETWARNVDEAWRNARMAGLTPLGLE
jgi:hypothetical protein